MVPLGLFRSRAVSVCVAIGFAVNIAFYGVIFVLSLYFQRVLGQSAVIAGLLNSSRQVGGTLAVAVFGALIAHRASFLAGMRASLLIAVVVLAVAAAAAATLPRPARKRVDRFGPVSQG
jgi:DHA2 family methylenomycin A resistance protein-like MFS transporter